MEVFVMAHEFGHIFNGDLATNPTLERVSLGGLDAQAVRVAQAQEIAADIFAYTVLTKYIDTEMEAMPDGAKRACNAGAEIFFVTMEMLDTFLGAATGGNITYSSKDTHPPPCDRREMMRVCGHIAFGTRENSVSGTARVAELILRKLTERTLPTFSEFAAKAGGLSPVWHLSPFG